MLTNRFSGIIAAALGIGGAFSMWAATLPTLHQCQKTDTLVQCVSRRGSHWPMLMVAGAAQLALAGVLVLSREDEDGQMVIDAPNVPFMPTAGAAASIFTNRTPTAAGGQYGGAEYEWVSELITHPQIRIVGAQGAGKSTFVRWLVEQRLARGEAVQVVDPHAEFGAWAGLEVVGRGMEWRETATFMKDFLDEVKSRYELLSTEANPNLPKATIVCEEMTNWDQEIDPKLIAKFDGALVADIRKVGFRVIKLAHDDTLSATGGKAGTKKAQNQYLQLTLDRKSDPSSPDGVSPAFTGMLTTAGREPQQVKTNPAWRPGQLGSTPVQPNPVNQPEPELNSAEPQAEQMISIDLGNLEPYRVQAVNLEKTLSEDGADIKERVKSLHERGFGQTDVILAVFGAKRGNTKAYKNARSEYRRILGLEDTDED